MFFLKDRIKFFLAYLKNKIRLSERSLSLYFRYIIHETRSNQIDFLLDKAEPKLVKYKDFYHSYFLMMAIKRNVQNYIHKIISDTEIIVVAK